MNKLLALFAFAVFAAFLFILAYRLGELDLWAITLLTLALAGYDFLTSARKKD
ncbi:MAG: hypothetical protein NWT12_13390 [Paracoccaceae bacterium]|jgi:hypothetical protein|nr:hypothetical protein [Paracoccaceae bacterium]MDP5367274.1 hypothetical protein [Paracoccaceae bacterium]